MLRLTRAVAESLHAAGSGALQVVSRELRDDACPSPDGECPNDVALYVKAERVVSLTLSERRDHLTARLYRRGVGFEKDLTLPCTWASGRIRCDAANLAKLLTAKAARPDADSRQPAKTIEQAMKTLEPTLKRCLRKGAAAMPKLEEPPVVLLRIGKGGRVRDVRIKPRALTEVPAYACMARAVESLRLPRGTRPTRRSQKFELPVP